MPKFLRFIDREGRAWKVYQFSRFPWMAATAYTQPGKHGGAHRGFVPEGGGVRRLYLMLPVLNADEYDTGSSTLQRQLDDSRIDSRDQPDVP